MKNAILICPDRTFLLLRVFVTLCVINYLSFFIIYFTLLSLFFFFEYLVHGRLAFRAHVHLSGEVKRGGGSVIVVGVVSISCVVYNEFRRVSCGFASFCRFSLCYITSYADLFSLNYSMIPYYITIILLFILLAPSVDISVAMFISASEYINISFFLTFSRLRSHSL